MKSQHKYQIDGARTLKRKLLGLCGKEAVKTSKEITDILISMGVQEERATAAVSRLHNIDIPFGYYKGLYFLREEDNSNKGYRIRIIDYEDFD